jgi:hypothetical protein
MEKESQQLSSFEANFLDILSKGFKKFDAIKENINFEESTLQNVINSLISKNIIKYDTIKQEYDYDTPVNGDKIILPGNILLPVTIIKRKDKILVTRGPWYEFPLDFDYRRIIWNVQLPNQSKSTLIDLIKESMLKERKSKIVQVEEYKNIANKIVPYNNNIKIKLNIIGEELIDVTIIFILKLKMNEKNVIDSDDISNVEFREFNVKSLIQTKDLINQLTCPIEERNFEKIKLNRIFNFSDFVFLNNSIPISYDKNKIEFVKITGIKQKLQLTYFEFDNSGSIRKNNTEEFLDVTEGINHLKSLFNSLAKEILLKNDILVETN